MISFSFRISASRIANSRRSSLSVSSYCEFMELLFLLASSSCIFRAFISAWRALSSSRLFCSFSLFCSNCWSSCSKSSWMRCSCAFFSSVSMSTWYSRSETALRNSPTRFSTSSPMSRSLSSSNDLCCSSTSATTRRLAALITSCRHMRTISVKVIRSAALLPPLQMVWKASSRFSLSSRDGTSNLGANLFALAACGLPSGSPCAFWGRGRGNSSGCHISRDASSSIPKTMPFVCKPLS
mmetsp:Transcript_32104/g.73414  ORF Transcript_32104/g.73414 Transcript_32104/m.73414 type:complete len:239 (-) Transcript_32104:527-1243(-)